MISCILFDLCPHFSAVVIEYPVSAKQSVGIWSLRNGIESFPGHAAHLAGVDIKVDCRSSYLPLCRCRSRGNSDPVSITPMLTKFSGSKRCEVHAGKP